MKTTFFYLLAFVICVNSTFSQFKKEHLIAYYSFDDSTANDHSGNGYHGTKVNNPQPDIGIHGTCMRFKGKNKFINSSLNKNLIGDHILLPHIPLDKFSEFTLSGWVNLEALEYAGGTAYVFFGTVMDRWIGIYHAGKYPTPTKWVKFSTGAFDDINEPILYEFDAKDLNNWIHYTLVYKDGVMSTYINGIFYEKKIQKVLTFSNFCGIATHWWYYDNEHRQVAGFTGRIDEVMIFNIALNDDEIKELSAPCTTPNASILSDGINFCEGDTVVLTLSKYFKNIIWSTGEKTRSIKVRKLGKYSATYYDDDNCKGYAEIQVSFNPNVFIFSSVNNVNVLNFDSVAYGSTICKELKIKNISGKTQSVNNLLLKYNLVFSIPQSQFPILLEAGEEKNFIVCFNPNQLGNMKDTIIFTDICGDTRIPIQGIGAPNFYFANTKCDIPLQSKTIDIINGGYLGLNTKYYESNNFLKLFIQTNISGKVYYNIYIYNYLGQLCFSKYDYLLIPQNEQNEHFYELTIPDLNLSNGFYYLNFNISNLSQSSKFTIMQ